MLPQLVLITLPIPSLLLLLMVGLYHLTPLLSLLPNIHLIPLLHHLSTLVPYPSKSRRNLPREFFNLPPRPNSPSTQATLGSLTNIRVLGIRQKVILVFALTGLWSLISGWVFLTVNTGGWWLLAMSVMPIPSLIATMGIFAIIKGTRPEFGSTISRIMGKGGISHSTIFSRILPLSTIPTILTTVVSAAIPRAGRWVILAFSSLVVGCVLTVSAIMGYRALSTKSTVGPVHLDADEVEEEPEGDWLTEPCEYS